MTSRLYCDRCDARLNFKNASVRFLHRPSLISITYVKEVRKPFILCCDCKKDFNKFMKFEKITNNKKSNMEASLNSSMICIIFMLISFSLGFGICLMFNWRNF